MKNPIKITGYASITLGLIYLFMFILYGVVIETAGINASPIQVLENIKRNYHLSWSANTIGYILFGIILTFMSYGLQKYFETTAQHIARVAAIFGYIWAGLVISCGMISNVLLQDVIMANLDTADIVLQTWETASIVIEGLGGGNEIVGGLWTLLISISFLRRNQRPKGIVILGLVAGIAGIATLFPLELFEMIFGVSQLIWFISLGVFLLKRKKLTE